MYSAPDTDSGTRTAEFLRVGPWVMLLPLAMLAFGVMQVRDHRRRVAPPVRTPEFSTLTDVDGFTGLLREADEVLTCELAALHADAGRQRFDQESLSRRLELPPGEPWKLVLRRSAPLGSLPVDVMISTVQGADTELRPFEAKQDARAPGALSASAPVDPLAVLFTRHVLRLAAEGEGAVVLWGPRPSGVLELELEIVPSGGESKVRRLELQPGRLAVDPEGAVLARVERRR